MKKILLPLVIMVLFWPVNLFAGNEKIVISFYNIDSSFINKKVPESKKSNDEGENEKIASIPPKTMFIVIEAGDYRRIFSIKEIKKETIPIESSTFYGTAYIKNQSSIAFAPWINW